MGKVKKEKKQKKQKQPIIQYAPNPMPEGGIVRNTAARYVPQSVSGNYAGSPYAQSDSKAYKRRAKRAARRSKLRERYNNMSLKAAFSMYVIFFMLLALILTALSMAVFSQLRIGITDQYRSQIGYDYYPGHVYADGEIIFYSYTDGDSLYMQMSGGDATMYSLLESLSFLAIPVIFITCIVLAGILFFRNRLEPPMKLLDESSQKIGDKDLDFTVSYRRDDEMGRLIDSFENMRLTLVENNNEMWRQMDERRRLNSAFSHDLRTPLTVLKGNTHMLKEYLPQGTVSDEKMESTITTMENHIERMENYINVMSSLQKLEDIEIHKSNIDAREFVDMLRNTSSILCEELTLNFYDDIHVDRLYIDDEIVMQVVDNIVSNATRYAKKRIAIVCNYINGILTISVSDDGDGFSADDLELATNPFYKSKKNVYDTHFGLGLNISKILTERHGGRLTLGNVEAGGALVKAEFSE